MLCWVRYTAMAGDYLDKITAMHRCLDELLAGPSDKWPERK